MAKVVYNEGFGGFGLSPKAIERYFELKGQKLYTYYQISHFDKEDLLVKEASEALEKELKEGYFRRNAFFTSKDFGDETPLTAEVWESQVADWEWEEELRRDRTNPILAQVVEELGSEVNAKYSNLKIREIPDGTSYTIKSYDGAESVMTKEELLNSFDWSIA